MGKSLINEFNRGKHQEKNLFLKRQFAFILKDYPLEKEKLIMKDRGGSIAGIIRTYWSWLI